jgi:hypothetical protein
MPVEQRCNKKLPPGRTPGELTPGKDSKLDAEFRRDILAA